MDSVSPESIERAIEFYANCPDGQYDIDVVIPALRELQSVRAQLAELTRESTAAAAHYAQRVGEMEADAARKDARVAALVEKWRNQLRAVGGMENGLVNVPAAGVRELLDEVLAVAQPEAARPAGERE